MFHYKKLSRLILVFALLGFGAKSFAQEQTSTEQLPRHASFTTISLEYVSWEELMRIENGAVSDNAYGQFFGNALSFERETYNSVRSGVAFSGAFLFGKANGGGTQTTLTYQSSQQSWMGAMASARFSYRMTPTVTASIGPMALYRHLSWADEGTGFSIKSGADLNLGILGELGLRIWPKWETRMEMGTLAFRASTYWSIGLGYKY